MKKQLIVSLVITWSTLALQNVSSQANTINIVGTQKEQVLTASQMESESEEPNIQQVSYNAQWSADGTLLVRPDNNGGYIYKSALPQNLNLQNTPDNVPNVYFVWNGYVGQAARIFKKIANNEIKNSNTY